jgi:hypothetical protein
MTPPQRSLRFCQKFLAAIQATFLAALMCDAPAATAGQKVILQKLVANEGAAPAVVPLPVAVIQDLGASVVEEYEAMAVVDLGGTTAAALAQATGLAVSPLPDHDRIMLRYFTLDAAASLPAGVVAPSFPADQPNLYLVVLRSIPKAEWVAQLEAIGNVVTYVPSNAYLIYAPLAKIAAARSVQPQIINVLPFAPEFKILDGERLYGPEGSARALVQVVKVPNGQPVVDLIEQYALPDTFGAFDLDNATAVMGELPNGTVQSLAWHPEVVSIEPAPQLAPSGERDALIVAGQLVSAQEGGRTVFKPDASVNYYSWLTQKGLGNTSDVLLGLLDTGLDYGSTTDVHVDFRDTSGLSRVQFQDDVAQAGNTSDCLAHGTLVAAVMAGSGGASTYNTSFSESATFANPCAGCTGSCPTPTNCSAGAFLADAGIAPLARVASAKIYNDSGSDWPQVPGRVNAGLALFADHGVLAANLSSNDSGTSYSAFSQALDQRVRDARGDPLCGSGGHLGCYGLSVVVSSGNGGGFVQAPATAKNVIAVGGSEGYNPFLSQTICYPFCATSNDAVNAHDVGCFSASGTPSSDGRIKPDIVAPATRVMGALTRWQPSTCWNGGAKYCGRNLPDTEGDGTLPGMGGGNPITWSWGTSFAAPAVTGAAGLTAKWYWMTHYYVTPSPAMIKAMVVNWALDISDGQRSGVPIGHFSRYQGFGKVDLGRAFPDLANVYSFDQQYVFTQTGETPWSKGLRVRDSGKPVRVTLVWTDKEGTNINGKVVQNNLVLTLETSVGRFSGDWFNPNTGESILYTRVPFPADLTNNVEHVIFTPSTYGISTMTVKVAPSAITAKAIPNGPGTVNQDFALFADNVCLIGSPGC